eukprot:910350-Rhodomonas_salina.1
MLRGPQGRAGPTYGEETELGQLLKEIVPVLLVHVMRVQQVVYLHPAQPDTRVNTRSSTPESTSARESTRL